MIGSIVEKEASFPSAPSLPPSSSSSNAAAASSSTGFPQATHRSLSRFALNKLNKANGASSAGGGGSRTVRAPALQTTAPTEERPNRSTAPAAPSSSSTSRQLQTEEDRIVAEAGRENDLRLASMSPSEIASEREELLARFGPGLGEILRKRREKRDGVVVDGAAAAGPQPPTPGPSSTTGRAATVKDEDDEDDLPDLVEDRAFFLSKPSALEQESDMTDYVSTPLCNANETAEPAPPAGERRVTFAALTGEPLLADLPELVQDGAWKGTFSPARR